ncbi:SDR family NAD(P)-dependent oxidoreductase [Mesorhizobium australicum]|uniref:3-oxoacyl-[acyl-carrier protein] reductase n=1 Tax=Mesorhizobium australicum TaxID=536018 RepID=A0A1X7MUV3_9HYPH|nr:SDR family oxidoreductase [Mesorhizobium australicum]SMH27723.1 3-oxoacyl-[acyl-carrier protein] reductase [Mesorhizobium australicum]
MNKRVCIVGATGGIGTAISKRFAVGNRVICMDLPSPALDKLAFETGAVAQQINVRSPESVALAFQAARDSITQIDILVLCFGIVDNTKMSALTLDRWQNIINVNLTGCFLCLREALEWLSDGARIVLLGSLAARTGGVLTGPAYAASKGAVESLTKSLAIELAPRGITVNCVAPGAVETDMIRSHSPDRRAAMVSSTPLGRMADPSEIADAVLYFASDGAGFTTGVTLQVNGGIRMD